MDKELLFKIKTELPKGAIGEIAKKAGTSRITVRNFLNGTSANIKVLTATNEIYTTYKKNMTELTAMAAMA